MKVNLRELFTFSSGERKGVIVLVIILLLVSGSNLLVVLHRPSILKENPPEWMNDTSLPIQDVVSPDKFPFDPNTVTGEDLLKLGFSPKISRIILNYRAKGGRFETPEDLQKIYGITQDQYNEIASFVRISHTLSTSGTNTSFGTWEDEGLLDINQADSAMFEKLPGIGPVLARRIIRYRTMLGGFYSIHQIKEVYGISDSLYLQISNRLAADTSALVKINVNTATEKELAHHPYIGKFAASGIIRYRSMVSGIKNLIELKVNGIFSDDVFEKIRNYLSL
jgi:DNA uptake protein ComE-like DNA-binding protein